MYTVKMICHQQIFPTEASSHRRIKHLCSHVEVCNHCITKTCTGKYFSQRWFTLFNTIININTKLSYLK